VVGRREAGDTRGDLVLAHLAVADHQAGAVGVHVVVVAGQAGDVPGGHWFPTLELAVTAAATVLCWYVIVALVIATVRGFLTRRVSRIVDAVTGTVLIGLGVLIAVT
jgi:threonine/homoserine/homoserine lactone efflux protein